MSSGDGGAANKTGTEKRQFHNDEAEPGRRLILSEDGGSQLLQRLVLKVSGHQTGLRAALQYVTLRFVQPAVRQFFSSATSGKGPTIQRANRCADHEIGTKSRLAEVAPDSCLICAKETAGGENKRSFL